VRGIATARQVEARVHSLGQKYVVNVASARAVLGSTGVHDCPDFMLIEHVAIKAVAHTCIAAYVVAAIGSRSRVLVNQVDKGAAVQVLEETFGVSPVGGHGPGVIHVEGMVRGRCQHGTGAPL